MSNPPLPNWQCMDCGHTEYLGRDDPAPEKCPECGSEKVINLRLKEL